MWLCKPDKLISDELEFGEFITGQVDAVSPDVDAEDEGPSTSSASIAMSRSDPVTWRNLSNMQRESIVLSGPPANPPSYPCGSQGRCFPQNVFYKRLQNGEKAYVDWLVRSQSANRFCFPCCLFHGDGRKDSSRFSSSDAGIKDNWRKLYSQVKSHERNSVHMSCYLDWKCLEVAVKEKKGIDSALQRQIDSETAKWKQILRCILDVVLFLAERNLPFRGSSSTVGDCNNGLFFGMLELLSKHNKVLEMHLRNVKQHQPYAGTLSFIGLAE